MKIWATIALALVIPSHSPAQQWVGARAGVVSYAQGDVYLDRVQLQHPVTVQIPAGKSLQTGNARVEIQLEPAVVLWMDENGGFRMDDTDPMNVKLTLEQGEILLWILDQTKHNNVIISLGEFVVRPIKPGLYRLNSGTLQFSVYAGKADIRSTAGRASPATGKTVNLGRSLKFAKFNKKKTDMFYAFATARMQLFWDAVRKNTNNRSMTMQQRRETSVFPEKPDWQRRLEQEDNYRQQQYYRENGYPLAGPHPQPFEPPIPPTQ